jgi:hypothetical protein
MPEMRPGGADPPGKLRPVHELRLLEMRITSVTPLMIAVPSPRRRLRTGTRVTLMLAPTQFWGN